jgi:hypothetical protein
MLFKFCFHKFIIFDKYRPLNNNTLGVLNIVIAAGNYLKAFYSSTSLKYVRDTNIHRVCKAKQENQITFLYVIIYFWESFTKMSIYLCIRFSERCEFVSKCISIVHECHGRTRTVQFQGENLFKKFLQNPEHGREKNRFFGFFSCLWKQKLLRGLFLTGKKVPPCRMLLKLVANTSVRSYNYINELHWKIETKEGTEQLLTAAYTFALVTVRKGPYLFCRLPLLPSSSHTPKSFHLYQGITKRCRLYWLTNSTLVYEPKCGGREGCGV